MLRHNGQPACFPTRKTWEAYKDACRYGGGHYSMCTDCTPEYKAQMEREMLCSHPEIEFRQDEDGIIEGFRPAQTEWQKKAERIVARSAQRVISVYRQSGTLRTFDFGSAADRGVFGKAGELIGVYGPGADLDQVADDLRAAA